MWHCLRSYIKNSCFGSHQGLQTPRNNKSTRPKRPRAFICFSVFGTPDETLALVVDILLQHQARRSAAYTNAASANCFEILCDRNLLEGYWQFIWCFCICCMHSHSQGFKGYCETKRTIPAIPREPG